MSYSLAIIAVLVVVFSGSYFFYRMRNEVISLRQYQYRYELVSNIASNINAGMSSDNIIDIALKALSQKFPQYRLSYSTISQQGELNVLGCYTPEHMPNIYGLQADLTIAQDYLAELTALKVLAVSDVLNDHRFEPLQAAMTAGKTRAVLDIPMVHDDNVVGIFCMDSCDVKVWTEHEINMLMHISKYLGFAISQAEYAKRQQQLESQLTSYAKSLEAKVAERTSELQAAKQLAEQMAMTDDLTKLPNRRAFFESSEKLFLQAKRYNKSLSILVFDIDRFKSINDEYGHVIGDLALQEIGLVMKSVFRASDIVGRIGGEEFAVTLPEANLEEAMQYGDRLRVVVEQHLINSPKGKINFTVSIGAASLRAEDKALKRLIARADDALYQAKEKGRNLIIAEQKLP